MCFEDINIINCVYLLVIDHEYIAFVGSLTHLIKTKPCNMSLVSTNFSFVHFTDMYEVLVKKKKENL